MDVAHKGIVTLLRSGITREKLQLPQGFAMETAFDILQRQSVVPLAYQGAVNCGVDNKNPIMQKMLMLCYQNLMKHELQMKAINQIFASFDEHGVPYMPVKGCNIKALYPKPEMRAMGDVDILIHPRDHDQIRPIMEALGFDFHRENDHVFEWQTKHLHVELHKSLVPIKDEDYYSYYGSGWQLAVKGRGCRYDLSPEDAYIFMFTHFARHYRGGGIGCRHVMDLFVYRNAYPDMNMAYISQELDKLHLLEFHENIVQMLHVWFSDETPDSVAELITSVIFSGGNWGTREAAIFSDSVKKARKTGKIRHSFMRSMISAVFPSIRQLSYRYTAIRKTPLLLPAVWVVRWIDILLFRPQIIKKRIRILRTINDERVLSHQQALEAVGLDYSFDNV